MRRVTARDATLDVSGLSAICRPQIQSLGYRGSRLVYVVPPDKHRWAQDPNSGLRLFAIEDVFLDHSSILLGCGSPNVYTAVYDDGDSERDPGWQRFAAFMCWRDKAQEVRTANRLQAGVLFELRRLPESARNAVRIGMKDYAGRSAVSCAYLNLAMLSSAGFTLGNGQKLSSVRPTRLASLIWRHGLCYQGRSVNIRIVVTGEEGVQDHFVGVWRKELMSACRLMAKKFGRLGGERFQPPQFVGRELPEFDSGRWSDSPLVNVGMSRPSWLGVKATFLWGQHPLYWVDLGELPQELCRPLKAYAGRRSITSRLKQHGPFSPPMVGLLNHLRNTGEDTYYGIPAHAVLDMLKPSRSPEHDTAELYNCVITYDPNGDARVYIASLRSDDLRGKRSRWVRFMNWMMAKHVLMANYHPRVAYACELWTCVEQSTGRPVLFINRSSGTYQPTAVQMHSFAQYLARSFNAEVRAVD